MLSLLYKLLQIKVPWQWKEEQQKAFESAKRQLTTDRILVHYDPQTNCAGLLCITLWPRCSAFPYIRKRRRETHSICFARSLASAEKRYWQLEKEALAIIFGIKQFHQFLYGPKFTILSDHKPLQGLLRDKGNFSNDISENSTLP